MIKNHFDIPSLAEHNTKHNTAMECIYKLFRPKKTEKPQYKCDIGELCLKIELLEEQIGLEIAEKVSHLSTIRRLSALKCELIEDLANSRAEVDNVWNFEVQNLKEDNARLSEENKLLKNRLSRIDSPLTL